MLGHWSTRLMCEGFKISTIAAITFGIVNFRAPKSPGIRHIRRVRDFPERFGHSRFRIFSGLSESLRHVALPSEIEVSTSDSESRTFPAWDSESRTGLCQFQRIESRFRTVESLFRTFGISNAFDSTIACMPLNPEWTAHAPAKCVGFDPADSAVDHGQARHAADRQQDQRDESITYSGGCGRHCIIDRRRTGCRAGLRHQPAVPGVFAAAEPAPRKPAQAPSSHSICRRLVFHRGDRQCSSGAAGDFPFGPSGAACPSHGCRCDKEGRDPSAFRSSGIGSHWHASSCACRDEVSGRNGSRGDSKRLRRTEHHRGRRSGAVRRC